MFFHESSHSDQCHFRTLTICAVQNVVEYSAVLVVVCFWHDSPPSQVGQGLLIQEVSRSRNDAPQSIGLLCTSDQPVAETSTWQHTTLTTDKHPCPGGIQTHNLSRRAAADLRLRRRGHWDRHWWYSSIHYKQQQQQASYRHIYFGYLTRRSNCLGCTALETSWIITTLCSAFISDYLLSIAACILNVQSPRCYSQCKYIGCSVAFEMHHRKSSGFLRNIGGF
jgi:hypothetical protein